MSAVFMRPHFRTTFYSTIIRTSNYADKERGKQFHKSKYENQKSGKQIYRKIFKQQNFFTANHLKNFFSLTKNFPKLFEIPKAKNFKTRF